MGKPEAAGIGRGGEASGPAEARAGPAKAASTSPVAARNAVQRRRAMPRPVTEVIAATRSPGR
jgi:hypothetical protein